MSPVSKQIVDMLDMLPEQEQTLALEVVKRVVMAWDPDFTKVTPAEADAIERGRSEFQRGEYTRL